MALFLWFTPLYRLLVLMLTFVNVYGHHMIIMSEEIELKKMFNDYEDYVRRVPRYNFVFGF